MDTSQEYIKICKKAEEIQKGWNPLISDVFIPPDSSKINFLHAIYGKMISGHIHGRDVGWGIEYCIWLPRQDQLQEMAIFESETPWGLLIRFYYWINDEIENQEKESFLFDSMEQLWLAFVMQQKFGKIWNGEDWVKKG